MSVPSSLRPRVVRGKESTARCMRSFMACPAGALFSVFLFLVGVGGR